MEYISSIQNFDHEKIDKNCDLKDQNMLEVLEDIFEYSIDKKGFYLESFPINSNIGSIYNSNKSDYIFYINKNKSEKFGISNEKVMNDYLHIDPKNWGKISDNKKEIDIKIFSNDNTLKNIKFKETNSVEELKRINTLFSEELKN